MDRGNPTSISGLRESHVRYPLTIPMSTLAKDAAAFKSALTRQNYTSWHSNPGPPQPVGDTVVEESGEKKKKKKPKHSARHFQFLLDENSEFPCSRCCVFTTGRYWYGEQCQHTVGLCGRTPQGLSVSTQSEVNYLKPRNRIEHPKPHEA